MCAYVDLDPICGTGRSQKKIPGQKWRTRFCLVHEKKDSRAKLAGIFFVLDLDLDLDLDLSSTLYIVMNLDNIENNIAKQTFQGKKRSPGMVNQGEVGADLYCCSIYLYLRVLSFPDLAFHCPCPCPLGRCCDEPHGTRHCRCCSSSHYQWHARGSRCPAEGL